MRLDHVNRFVRAVASNVPLWLIAFPLAAQDTVRVRADGPARWSNVRLVQELSVGQVDGPPEYALGSIYLVAPARDGSFYMFDGNDGQIRRYDSQGKYLRLIGRRGGGPGEYQTVGGMSTDVTGSLVVFDPGSQRVTHFSAEGKVVREWRTNLSSWNDFYVDSRERYYFRTSVVGGPQEGPGARFQYVRFSEDNRRLDSLLIPQLVPPAPAYRGFYTVTADGGRNNFLVQNLAAVNLAGGAVFAASDAYRVFVNDGQRVRVLERTAQPVRLGSEEREQWLEWADTVRAGRTQLQYEIPRVKPFIRDLRTDHQGRIWVDVYVQAEKRTNLPPTRRNGGKMILHWRERTTYDVFSPAGEYLGRVPLPADTRLLAIQGDRLYTITRGADDEERMIVYRLLAS